MNWTDDEIKGKILHKLTRFGKFEHSHTAIEHLRKGAQKPEGFLAPLTDHLRSERGFPKDTAGKVKEIIHDLKKEGILKSKPTGYGEQVSINVDMTEKVMEYIDRFLKKE